MKHLTRLFLIFTWIFISSIPIYAGKVKQVTLDNGMVVILKENHSTPMVASIVCVRAGSKFEDTTNNGFTHFLEHLLFNGTENLSRLELNEGFKDHGGYINAFTQKDLTGYLFVIPSMFAEYAVKTQADQLFNSTLPEQEFPKERKIVIEEIKMYYDSPETQAEMYFDSLIYQATPYAQTVLGPIDVIETIPRERVLDYYRERYVPNNMIALFIGDFKAEEFIKVVNKYFGAKGKGQLPEKTNFEISPPYANKVLYREYPGKITKIHLVLPAPNYNQPGYYAADMLTQILNSGETSPLNRALTSGDDPLVTEMSVYLEATGDFSLLHFTADTDSPDKVQKIIATTTGFLSNLENHFIDSDQLKRIVTVNKTEQIYLEEKLHYYGIIQAPMLVNFGYDYITGYVDSLKTVSISDINQVSRDYFGPGKYLAMAAIPESAEENQ